MTEIVFTIRDAYGPGSTSRLVDVEDASGDIRNMQNADEVVAPHVITVVIGYPLYGKHRYRLRSANAAGFTRAGIARALCRLLHVIWRNDELDTMQQIEAGVSVDSIEDRYGVPSDISIADLQLAAVTVNSNGEYEPVFET